MKQKSLFKKEKSHWDSLPKDTRPIFEKRKHYHFDSMEDYYKSEQWKIKRQFILHRDKRKCRWCGAKTRLEIHHLTYDRLYNEENKDLITLCKSCHKKADDKRRIEKEFEVYNSRLDTYATKKYGENWEYRYSYEEIEAEFDVWCDRKA